jgi:transposase InsO family protein
MAPCRCMRSSRHSRSHVGTTGSRGSCARLDCWGAVGSHRLQTGSGLPIAPASRPSSREEGFLSLAVILDVFSRRVVGWSMQEHLRTELVLAALDMAICSRCPGVGLIHHSDHGCQYTSLLFGERCAATGIRSSMGIVGDCDDNAMVDRFFATLECELLATHRFQTHAAARGWRSLSGSKAFLLGNDDTQRSAMWRQRCYERTATTHATGSREAHSPRNQGYSRG